MPDVNYLFRPNHSSNVLKLAGDALSALVMPAVFAIVAARDETDLEQLNAELLRVVHETVQPEFVGCG